MNTISKPTGRTKKNPPHFAAAPRFLIVAEPLDFTIHIDDAKPVRVNGDVTTAEGCEDFRLAIIALDERFSRGDGLAAVALAVDELATGQPIAGTSATELRETIKSIAISLGEQAPAQKPKRERKPKALSFAAQMGLAGVGVRE